MYCQNPFCQGEPEFENTDKERLFFGEFEVDEVNTYYCRQCREMRRITFRNERNFYKRKCDHSGEEIWSIYHSSSLFKVYHKDVWWSDAWDGLSFGRDFDFNRNFFEQYHELMMDVPHPALIQDRQKNSEFTMDALADIDCYMIFETDNDVNCHYGNFINCKDSMDCEGAIGSELCYDSLYIKNCHEAVAAEYCVDCSNIYFSSNLVNCHNCIFCFGLRDQKNCIFNTQVSADVFMNFVLQRQLFRRRSYKKADDMFMMFLETAPQRYMYLLKTENSSGDRLINCTDCENCYHLEDGVNCVNVASACLQVKDSMDCWSIAYGTERSFENQTCVRGGFNFVANFSNDCSNCFYIDNCRMCQECFGCVGLKNKKHCIFNKQYTPEAYRELMPKIKEHMKKTREWGQFLPFWASPFAYNSTLANIYFPMQKEEYLQMLEISEQHWPPGPRYKRDHLWLDKKSVEASKNLTEENNMNVSPPDSIFEAVNDEILNTVYYDRETNEPFRIMGRELAFYQKMKLPLPDLSFQSRYKKLLGRYNPRKLHARNCQKCREDLKTTFKPDSPYIVFCEKCFVSSLK